VKGTTKYNDDDKMNNDAGIIENGEDMEEEDQDEEMQHMVDEIVEPTTREVHPAEKEILHLRKRLRNVQESVQLSSTAIANPATWQANVLNAVQNSVNEWRAILTHYPDLERSALITKEPALAVYMLIQLAMQSGPLAGGKPGYFKRCGSEAAKVALIFLQTVVSDAQEAQLLCFTERQGDAIQKWKQGADKAVNNDKPPSKSVLKTQDNANKAKGKK
jgi:hypothetical protein